MTKVTTIKIQEETKKRLDKLKEHKKESYEEVLRKMLYILNTCRKNPEKAKSILRKIYLDIQRKQGYTQESQGKQKYTGIKKQQRPNNPKK